MNGEWIYDPCPCCGSQIINGEVGKLGNKNWARCRDCGTQYEVPNICPSCEAQIEGNAEFCDAGCLEDFQKSEEQFQNDFRSESWNGGRSLI